MELQVHCVELLVHCKVVLHETCKLGVPENAAKHQKLLTYDAPSVFVLTGLV